MGQLVKDYNKALKLARKGDYLTARKLMLPYKDDEDAVKLLKRINVAILKERNHKAEEEEQRERKYTLFDPMSNLSTGTKIFLVLFILALIRSMWRLFLSI